MQFLPIIERELRVAARQPKTWWRRVLTLGAALALFTFVFLTVGQWGGLSAVGGRIFGVLGGFGTVYALLAGPFATTDCVSRERREGTLGLLFLTDLRSYDVVLGKMAAASLHLVLDLIAALPVVAMPVLMGGVSLGQLAFVMLALANIMFLSLAVGTCASARLRSGRSSLAVTLGVLFLLSVGLMFLGQVLMTFPSTRPAAPYLFMFCPISTMVYCLGGLMRSTLWGFWLNMGCLHALGWVCLLVACRSTANSWRDLPASARELRWRERLAQWRKRSASSQRACGSLMLEQNPVAWLEGRDQLQERMLWCILFVTAIAGALIHLRWPDEWPDDGWIISWPILVHYVLCVWIAIQAPRRLADDKESGALELLLCTPLKPAAVVSGCMMILRRRFGRGLLALLVLDAVLACAYFSQHGSWQQFQRNPFPDLAACALLVFPVQAYSMARIGVYQGLVATTSLRATFMLLWKAGLLPWLLWIGFMVGVETSQRYLRVRIHISDRVAFAAWTGAHLLPCGLFLAHADWQLRFGFRSLAAQTRGVGWWKRWRGLSH